MTTLELFWDYSTLIVKYTSPRQYSVCYFLPETMPFYDEIEIEDMTFDSEKQVYSYPCPCGDKFTITLEDLWDGEDTADCQSCTLFVTVVYDESDLPELRDDDDDDESDGEEKEKEENSKGTEKKDGKATAEKGEEITEAVKNLSIKSQ